jgi:hypothetical protein
MRFWLLIAMMVVALALQLVARLGRAPWVKKVYPQDVAMAILAAAIVLLLVEML